MSSFPGVAASSLSPTSSHPALKGARATSPVLEGSRQLFWVY